MKEYDRFEKGAANSSTRDAFLPEETHDLYHRRFVLTLDGQSRIIKVCDRAVKRFFMECELPGVGYG